MEAVNYSKTSQQIFTSQCKNPKETIKLQQPRQPEDLEDDDDDDDKSWTG
jgi:hypothetical protein